MAAMQRRPQDVIHHSDQGSQYSGYAFGQRCQTLGVRPSMGSRGDAYDNAMAESFFSTLECECLAKHRFPTHTETGALHEGPSSVRNGWTVASLSHSALS